MKSQTGNLKKWRCVYKQKTLQKLYLPCKEVVVVGTLISQKKTVGKKKNLKMHVPSD